MKKFLLFLVLIPFYGSGVEKSIVYPNDISLNGALMEGYYFKQKKFSGSTCISGNSMANIEKKATIYFDSSIVYHELCNILNGGFSIGKGIGNPGLGSFDSSCFAYPYGLYNPFQPSSGFDRYGSDDYNNEGPFGSFPDWGIGDGAGLNLSVAAKFLKFSRETKTAFSLTFGYNLELGNQYLADTRIGKEYLAMMEQSGRFKAVCGDHFIYQIQRGAYAFVTVKIDAGSKLNKREIGKNLNFNIGLLSLGAILKHLKQKYGNSIKMDIRGIQRGGDANMLSEVIGDGQLCSDQDNYGCKDIITSLHRYFSETLPMQFNQIDYGADGLKNKSVALKYATRTYCSVSGKVPKNCAWPDISGLTDKIEKNLKEEKNDLKKANDALSTLLLDKKKYLALAKYRMHRLYNIALLEKSAEECLQDHAKCEIIYKEATSYLNPLLSTLFEGLPTTKLENQIVFCFRSDLPVMNYVNLKLTSRLNKNLGTYRIDDFGDFDFDVGTKKCFKRILTRQIKDLEKIEFKVSGQVSDRKGKPVESSVKCGIGKKKIRSRISWKIDGIEILREGKRPLKIGGHSFFQKNKCRDELVEDTWEIDQISFEEL